MVVRDVQLLDESVKTRTIAADVVIPADIDETAAFNFSSASSTFVGRATGLVDGVRWTAGTAITMALNISSASGTFAGVATGNLIGVLGPAGTIQEAALNFSSASGTFAGRVTGLIDGSRYTAGTAITMALNISSASGTFAGVATGAITGALAATIQEAAVVFNSTSGTFGNIGLNLVAKTTANNNFTGTSSTYAGVVNSANTTSTIGNLRGSMQTQGLEVSVAEGSTNTNFTWGAAFSGVPIVAFAETSATVNQRVSVVVTTTGGTLRTTVAAASTYNVIGVFGY